MAITTSGNKNVDFLGLTERVRKNILMALVGNLSNATWAGKTVKQIGGTGDHSVLNIERSNYEELDETYMTCASGSMIFKDSDQLNMLVTDHGIWVKIYPTRGRYHRNTGTGKSYDDFCVYLTLCYAEPNSDGSNVIEPSTKVSPDEKGGWYIDDDGVCDDVNFCRFPLAARGISDYLTICDSNTPKDGNDGRDVAVVAAINSAMRQEIKFNRSTHRSDPEQSTGWLRKYEYFALYTGPGTEEYPGQLIAWGKLTKPVEVEGANVVPLFEEGQFRLFFPAPNEVEAQIDAPVNSYDH